MTHASHLTCPARVESVPLLKQFVEDACAKAALGADEAMAVRMSVEEVCENVIRYGYAGREPGPLSIDFTDSGERVEVTVEDRGAPFDPAQLPAADVTSDWKERQIGGLGWHLVHRLMDEVRYEPVALGGNRVTLVKRRLGQT